MSGTWTDPSTSLHMSSTDATSLTAFARVPPATGRRTGRPVSLTTASMTPRKRRADAARKGGGADGDEREARAGRPPVARDRRRDRRRARADRLLRQDPPDEPRRGGIARRIVVVRLGRQVERPPDEVSALERRAEAGRDGAAAQQRRDRAGVQRRKRPHLAALGTTDSGSRALGRAAHRTGRHQVSRASGFRAPR